MSTIPPRKIEAIATSPPPLLPPPTCLHPLTVLDHYLASLSSSSSSAFSLSSQSPTEQQQQQQDEILRVVDSLYGGGGSSSCLDGALQVLEQNCGSTDASGRTFCCYNVTRLQSPRRSLFTVKGSGVSRGQAAASQQDTCYLCILPETKPNLQQEDFPAHNNNNYDMYYCSCRSFLERSRCSTQTGAATSTTTATTIGGAICKHLLALKLMPVLGMTPSVMEFGSEEEFSRAVLQRLSPRI